MAAPHTELWVLSVKYQFENGLRCNCWMKVTKGPTLTCPAAQSTTLHPDRPPAACTQTSCPEMFGIT